MLSIFFAILAFDLMIFLHELGHFAAAKAVGLEVKEFAIGFGKKLVSKEYKGTAYSLRLLPLGGFNAIPSLDGDAMEKQVSLKSFGKRFLVLFAGSGANLASAYVCLACMMLFIGAPAVSPTIASVSPGCAAENVIQPQDKIVSVNGRPVGGTTASIKEATMEMRSSSSVVLGVERDGEPLSFEIAKEQGQPLGITFGTKYVPVPAKDIVWATNDVYGNMLALVRDGAERLAGQDTKISETVAGPIGVTQAMYNAQGELGVFGLGFMFVVVSINLAIFNLLPLPVLDGGHIFLQAAQFVTGVRLKEKHIRAINYAGLAVLGCLFFLGTYADLHRLAGG